MDAESYLHWLGTIELANAKPGDVRQAVNAIVETLSAEAAKNDEQDDDGGEMLQALLAIQAELAAGRSAQQHLDSFRQEFLYDTELPLPPQVVLENELREIACGIARSRWCTETYENLEKAIDRFLDGGDEEGLWTEVDTIDEILERVSQSYKQTAILPKEVTMESMVTHQLLCQGIEEWKSALELLRDGEEEPDWTAVLKRAETGNRLLVAVQIYHQRLQSALSTY